MFIMYPYPIKNWRNESAYSEHDDLNIWAWEFLRRNPEYQEDIDRCEKGVRGFEDIYIFDHPLRNPEKERYENIFCRLIGDIEDLPDNNPYLLSQFGIYSNWKSIIGILSSKYGIYTVQSKDDPVSKFLLPLPRVDTVIPEFFKDDHISVEWFGFEMCKGRSATKNKYEMSIKFDLKKPLDKQIEHARDLLDGQRLTLGIKNIKKPRVRLNMYVKYIRVLDAIADGVSHKDIARELVPHISNVNSDDRQGIKTILNWIEAGKKLVRGGYLDIAILTK